MNDVIKHLADFEFRQAVIAVLTERADADCSDGDRFLPGGQYAAAIARWRSAAQRRRAAKALAGEQPVHADDMTFVGQACAEVHAALWKRFAEENGLAA